MGLEQNAEQVYREPGGGKYTEISAARQLKNYEQVVRLNCAVAFNLTLPPVAEARGRFYSFLIRVATAAVTLKSAGDAESWTDVVFNSVGDRALLYSDGLCWHVLSVGTA